MPTLTKKKPGADPKRGVIRFKWLLNRMVPALAEFSKDGHVIMPPHSTKLVGEAEVTDYSYPGGRRKIERFVSVFDLAFEHELTLPECEPRIVASKPGMPDSWREALQAKEYERALENQDRADKLRKLLRRLASPMVPGGSATIEITYDPEHFLEADGFISDEEFEVRKRRESEELAMKMLTLANAKKSRPAVRG